LTQTFQQLLAKDLKKRKVLPNYSQQTAAETFDTFDGYTPLLDEIKAMLQKKFRYS
jgi:hypothetical protein